MIAAIEPDTVRTDVSFHLFQIHILCGKLSACRNLRQLPAMVEDALLHIKELELLENKYFGFQELLEKNIQRITRYAKDANIFSSVTGEQALRKLRLTLYQTVCPLIKKYCDEEQKFLDNIMQLPLSVKEKKRLLNKTVSNCSLLFAFCMPHESILLLDLKSRCERQMAGLGIPSLTEKFC